MEFEYLIPAWRENEWNAKTILVVLVIASRPEIFKKEAVKATGISERYFDKLTTALEKEGDIIRRSKKRGRTRMMTYTLTVQGEKKLSKLLGCG